MEDTITASAVADPPNLQTKPERGAVGSDTQPPPPPPPANQNPNPKPEVKGEEDQKPPAVKKRRLDYENAIRSSTYFKIRSIINDLRPFFLQVIQAPDFRKNKAAHDIRKQMKTMLELTWQLRSEASLAQKNKEEKHKGQEKHAAQAQNGEVPSSTNNAVENAGEVKKLAEQLKEGFQVTYAIGGSPVGWNYLTYPGSKPIYYGVSKASFRASQAAN